jgi:hypothetical protein
MAVLLLFFLLKFSIEKDRESHIGMERMDGWGIRKVVMDMHECGHH